MRETEPTTITQGERIEWTRSFADYSAEDYTLEYRFRGPGNGFNVTATADGAAFVAVVTTANSLTCAVAKYSWQAWLTEIADEDNVFMAASGETTVKRGFATAKTGQLDLRSAAKIALDAIDAVLANAATSDQLEYEISTPAGSRRIRRMSRVELLTLRKHFVGIVARENAMQRVKNGGPFNKTVKARLYDA